MVFAGILAGGTGSRMGNYTVPKQFLTIKEKPIIVHVVEKFLIHPEVDVVIVGVNPQWYQYMLDIQKKYFSGMENFVVVPGGEDRNGTICKIIEETKTKVASNHTSIKANKIITERDIFLTGTCLISSTLCSSVSK